MAFPTCSQAQPVFNVMNYGATGNGASLDSPAINSAIAAAGAAGGGVILFPAGKYFCGSIHLTNNITMDLSANAFIMASKTNMDPPEVNVYSNYQDYGHSYFHDALIWGENLTNITFEGSGEITGNG
ncbi:MAG TPA: glycosyl hydrolase family 28-related protein, partial [Pseudomonadales bacterium]|nr:glycosyl hydrolase family 28-related protein [Pseudomonadales bacterium]